MEESDGGCISKPNEAREDNDHLLKEQNIMDTDKENNNEVTAAAPVLPLDLYYKMNHGKPGLLLIFNHETFEESTHQTKRSATDKDVEKIIKTFGQNGLGFEIHPYQDMTLKQIQAQIDKYVEQDFYHKQRDCLAIFILTHGCKDVLWAKDARYDPAVEIWGKFTSDKCPSLAGKPKLIFIQACQGSNLDPGIKLMLPKRTEFDGFSYYTYPVYADFLIFYATYEGYYAFRNDVNGSYWITLLCEELQTYHKNTDIQAILTFVNRRLAVEFTSSNSRDQSKSEKKQISYFKSSLTRLLVFGKK